MITDNGKTYLYGEIPKPKTETTPQEDDSQAYLYGELLDRAVSTLSNDPVSQSFLYGEVCSRAEKANYHGSETASAETVVDGTTIKVNVNKNFVAAEANRAVLNLDLTNKVKIQISKETERAMLVEADLQRQIDELKAQIQGGN